MRIGNMAGLTNMPLGGRNAIGLWFGRMEYNWAFVVIKNIISLSGIGSRADEAMNSSHIANAFTLFATFLN